MKKTLLILSAVFLFGATSCNKEKDCLCTNTIVSSFNGEDEEEEKTTYSQTIKKGSCSDLNSTSTTQVGGMTATSTANCVEK